MIISICIMPPKVDRASTILSTKEVHATDIYLFSEIQYCTCLYHLGCVDTNINDTIWVTLPKVASEGTVLAVAKEICLSLAAVTGSFKKKLCRFK